MPGPGDATTPHQTLVLENFPGYFIGPTFYKLPLGALISGGGSLGNGDRSYDFLMTEQGEVRRSGGYSEVFRPLTQTPARGWRTVSSLHFWELPKGGEFLLGAGFFDDSNYSVRFLDFRDPRRMRDPAWNDLTVGLVAPVDPSHFSMFEPFGDAVYFVDGLNPMLRVTARPWDRRLTPAIDFAGVGRPDQDVSGAIQLYTNAYGLMDRRFEEGRSPLLYAFTVTTKWGESPILSKSVMVSGVLYNSTEVSGPSGATPHFVVSWEDLVSIFPDILTVNVYRYDKTIGTFRLATRMRKGDPFYTDVKTNLELGQPIPLDNGFPSNFRLIRQHNDRMFAVGGYGKHNRISCSKLGLPDVWPPQYELLTVDGSRGDNIQQMRVMNGNLYFFLRDRILRLVGFSPEDFALESVADHVGCIAPKTLAPWEDGVVFLGARGVYFFNGTTLTRLSQPLAGLFERGGSGLRGLDRSVAAVAGDTYHLAYHVTSESTRFTDEVNNFILTCNLRTGAWGTRARGAFLCSTPFKKGRSFVSLDYHYPGDFAVAGIYVLSDWPLMDERSEGPILDFARFDMDLPDQEKSIEFIEIMYESLSETTITAFLYRDVSDKELALMQAGTIPETFSVIVAESENTDPTRYLRWGDAWNIVTNRTAPMVVHRARIPIESFSGRSFLLGLTVGANGGLMDFRLQKISIQYQVVKSSFEGAIT